MCFFCSTDILCFFKNEIDDVYLSNFAILTNYALTMPFSLSTLFFFRVKLFFSQISFFEDIHSNTLSSIIGNVPFSE